MLNISTSGSFRNIEKVLKSDPNRKIRRILEVAGQRGVAALSAATPQDTGLASLSWYYRVVKTPKGMDLIWYNSDIENGFPVALMIQYGHGTGTGGYVQGYDYINPALRPIFDNILNDIRKAVKTA